MAKLRIVAPLALLCACAPAPAPSNAYPTAPANGPEFVRVITPFEVRDESGKPYDHPFFGGFDVPRPQFIDIDDDGDLDLFVQERSNELMFFENTGSVTKPVFTWRTDRYQNLEIGEWNRFTDLDRDGDYDLIAEQPFSYIKFFRNVGSRKSPQFTLAADSLRDAEGRPIFADRQNIPNLADIDCDGLIDLFLGRVEGTITRYERIDAQDSVPRFRFITDRFEDIEIIAQIGSMHGANTMYWADAEGDGDPDLFWGDFFEPGVLYIQNNSATCSVPNLRVEPVQLIVDGARFRTSGYNVPVVADIDGDKDWDVFIGVLGGAYNPHLTSADNFYFLERADGQLTRKTGRFIYGIDVGTESVPTFGDLDGDGDLDMLIGNKLDPKHAESGRIYRFENTGTRTQPAFRLADTLNVATAFHQAPALGDLDGDGDPDMVLGTWNDGVLVLYNQGGGSFVMDSTQTIKFTRGSNYTPTLVDIDADGDLDIVVGEASGEFNLVRNNGTRTQPRFVVESELWQNLDAGRRSHPAFADLDGDGDLDLLSGSEEAYAVYFRNDGTKQQPRFVRDDSLRLPFHHLAAPAFADLDGDGDADLIVGSLSGGVTYYQRR